MAKRKKYRLVRFCKYREAWCVIIRSKWLRRRLFADEGDYEVLGFVLGPLIFFRSEHVWRKKKVRDHEYRHYQQSRSEWFFTLRYIWANIRFGYKRNPYEIDANRYARREAAKRRRRRRRRA